MNAKSRTVKSLKNAQVALLFYFVNLVLQFFSRKIFLDYLGNELLGLNTTAMTLLQFLNLAELGVGAAVAYSLYEPLASDNRKKVNEIVSIQGFLYNRIGLIVLGASILLMCFFPYFFAKAQVSLWYAYATFGVLLVSALAGYFFNYRQIVLTSDQKEYKLNYAIQTVKVLKIVLQIIAIRFLLGGYIWWLILELIAVFITVVGVNYVIRCEYPWLKTNILLGRKLIKEYPEITRKTKQLFFHKIAGYAVTQTSPLIIYGYASLTLVAMYGNYMLIITGISALLGAVFNSMNAGIGNLVAEGNVSKNIQIFDELFSIRFLLSCIACFGIYKLTSAFIILWLGKDYILDNITLLLLVATMFINLSRLTVDAYINAYGLFKDTWAPIVETIINITMSITLGYYFGLHGILFGVLLSLTIIVVIWKPFFLFNYGFKESIGKYFSMYFKHILIAIVSYFLSQYFITFIPLHPSASTTNFLLCGMLYSLIFGSVLFLGLYITTRGMRDVYTKSKVFIKK